MSNGPSSSRTNSTFSELTKSMTDKATAAHLKKLAEVKPKKVGSTRSGPIDPDLIKRLQSYTWDFEAMKRA